jgi:hypothetical protein
MWNTLQGLVKFLQANAKVFQTHPEGRDLVAEVISFGRLELANEDRNSFLTLRPFVTTCFHE